MIQFQNEITIDRPVEEIFAFLANFKTFPSGTTT